MLSRNLGRRLKAVAANYRLGLVSRDQALAQARRYIDAEFETMLRVSRDRIRWTLGRAVELPDEARTRLERVRDQYVSDFEKILGDVK